MSVDVSVNDSVCVVANVVVVVVVGAGVVVVGAGVVVVGAGVVVVETCCPAVPLQIDGDVIWQGTFRHRPFSVSSADNKTQLPFATGDPGAQLK